MSVYLGASVLIAIFTDDAHSGRVDVLLKSLAEPVVVSDFAAAERASALSRKVRMGLLATDEARAAFSDFDAWVVASSERADIRPADIAMTAGVLRRLDLSLRTPDALNIAVAHRLNPALATMDRKMAADALALGIAVVPAPTP